jgi:5'/3'-nucleotidase SurE
MNESSVRAVRCCFQHDVVRACLAKAVVVAAAAVASLPAQAAGELCGRGPLDILLTNDDGYEAPGIRALYKALRAAGHRVTMVAPATNMSGTSASLTRGEISVVRDKSDANVMGVTATPASSTLIAVEAPLVPVRPDLVVSGINDGENVSAAIAFSGTVGAVIAGVRLLDPPVPGIAVSAARPARKPGAPAGGAQTRNAALGKRFATLLSSLRPWFCSGATEEHAHRALNVNFPAVDVASIKGVRAVEPAPRADFGLDYERNDAGGYRGRWVDSRQDAGADTDIGWLARGYITVTPLDASYAASQPDTVVLRKLLDGTSAQP